MEGHDELQVDMQWPPFRVLVVLVGPGFLSGVTDMIAKECINNVGRQWQHVC